MDSPSSADLAEIGLPIETTEQSEENKRKTLEGCQKVASPVKKWLIIFQHHEISPREHKEYKIDELWGITSRFSIQTTRLMQILFSTCQVELLLLLPQTTSSKLPCTKFLCRSKATRSRSLCPYKLSPQPQR